MRFEKTGCCYCINIHGLMTPYSFIWHWSILLRIMACRRRQTIDWTNAHGLPIGPKIISMKFYEKFERFHSIKCIWNCGFGVGAFLSFRAQCLRTETSPYHITNSITVVDIGKQGIRSLKARKLLWNTFWYDYMPSYVHSKYVYYCGDIILWS